MMIFIFMKGNVKMVENYRDIGRNPMIPFSTNVAMQSLFDPFVCFMEIKRNLDIQIKATFF